MEQHDTRIPGSGNTDLDSAQNGTAPLAVPAASPFTDARKLDTKDYIKDGFHAKTKGESLFNKLVYGGVGFGIVTAVSIFFTWLLRDSKNISPKYTALVNRAQEWAKKGRDLTPHEAGKIDNAVDSAMTIGALFTGGTVATVLPIKSLEDNKASIVKTLDERIYGAEKVASDPEIQAAHRELDVAPKQTWKSVFWSRVIAFIGTFTVWGIIGENSRPLAEKMHGSIDSISVKSGRAIDGFFRKNNPEAAKNIDYMRTHSPNDMRRRPAPDKGIHQADALPTRIWTYVTQDGLYTALTSGLLYVSTRVLGPFFDKPHEEGIENRPSPEPHAPKSEPAPIVATAAPHAPQPRVDSITHKDTLAPTPAIALGA